MKIEPNKCHDCRFAYLMKSDPYNPVVSECTITKQREVASSPIRCRLFKKRVAAVEIHPMKYLNHEHT